jgi:hypothetical protein
MLLFLGQCIGSGSTWIRIQLVAWVRTRIRNWNAGPDPHSFEKLDPDPHSPKKLDPDPHKVNADPKHCPKVTTKIHLEFLIAASSSRQGQPGGLIATYIHIS